MLAAYTLSQLLHMCAPDVGARTMTAIISVESGGNPLAIHDNTLRRSFSPHDTRQAVVWANQLLALHHSVDLGLSQINNANLPRLGLTVPEVFDACSNVSAASLILALDYRAATQQFGAGQYALRHAIGAYNSGSLFAGYAYIDRILAAAGLGASQAIAVPDLQAVPLALRLAAAPPPSAGVAGDVSARTNGVGDALPHAGSPVALTRIAPAKPAPSRGRVDRAPILITTGLSAGGAELAAGIRAANPLVLMADPSGAQHAPNAPKAVPQ